jgi:two-component system OmpR family response regulator
MSTSGRILIVDDSETILTRAKAALTASGYEVVTTSQTVGSSRYLGTSDLAIIDFHMPGLDGKDLASSMRRALVKSSSECKLYLYTTDEAIAADYRRLGFDGSFTMKGNEKALVDQVRAFFRMRGMMGLAARVKKALES